MTYTQVELKEDWFGHCTFVRVAWIPSKYAVVGKELQFKNLPGKWKVTSKYNTKEESDVLAHERLYLKHREGSDV